MGEDSTVTSRRAVVGIAGAAGLIAGITLLARAAGLGRVLVFADAVPAFGIVVAVMGVVNVMGSVGSPPAVLGKMIGGALA